MAGDSGQEHTKQISTPSTPTLKVPNPLFYAADSHDKPAYADSMVAEAMVDAADSVDTDTAVRDALEELLSSPEARQQLLSRCTEATLWQGAVPWQLGNSWAGLSGLGWEENGTKSCLETALPSSLNLEVGMVAEQYPVPVGCYWPETLAAVEELLG